MNRTEARKVGNELKAKGMTYKEIAVELGNRGYRTGQGKSPQWYDINYLLNTKRYMNYNKVKPNRMLTSDDLNIVKGVVYSNKIDNTKKVEILKIVLENKGIKPLDLSL